MAGKRQCTMKRNPSFLPPVILIGMHRSGTSLICRVLEELGLFVGNKLERNREAWFFLHSNEWIFRQGGAAWDNPEVLAHVLDNPDLRELVSGRMRDILHSPHAISYLGLRRYLRCCNIPSINFPWGWKEPRNTFTLPLWQEIFPQVKITRGGCSGKPPRSLPTGHRKGQGSKQKMGTGNPAGLPAPLFTVHSQRAVLRPQRRFLPLGAVHSKGPGAHDDDGRKRFFCQVLGFPGKSTADSRRFGAFLRSPGFSRENAVNNGKAKE